MRSLTGNSGMQSRPCASCDGRGGDGVLQVCAACDGHGVSEIKCPQCSMYKQWGEFVGKQGRIVKRCAECAAKYQNWHRMTLEEREAATDARRELRTDGPLRVKLVLESGNRKTGKILVSMTSARTCPTTCGFYGKGCYAEQHLVGMHWRKVSNGDGYDWHRFLNAVRHLPDGQVWRHNEAGDLPGDDGVIDGALFMGLIAANVGKRGFTYTHKPVLLPDESREKKPGLPAKLTHDEWLKREKNYHYIEEANKAGFTVNFSADSLDEADRLYDLGIAPVTVVLPHDAPNALRTPDGRHVIACPAETHETVSCKSCKLCAVGKRKVIVGFRAHGGRAKQITQRMRQLPMFQASAPRGASAVERT